MIDMYQYGDVALDVVKSLDTDRINKSVSQLHANDQQIFLAHDFTPQIWENRWFNNDAIVGYPAGYCVWKNVYNDVSSFLDAYGEVVYNYAQENSLLQNVIISSWEDVKRAYAPGGRLTPAYEIWKDRYYNAISGYSKVTQTSLTKSSQVTYLKLEITKAVSSGSAIDICEIDVLGESTSFNFNTHSTGLSTDAVVFGELLNLVDGSESTHCKLETEDGKTITTANPITIILQIGTDYLSLNAFQRWSMTFVGQHIAIDFNLYCSEDGEHWAYLDQVVGNSAGSWTTPRMFRLKNTSYRKQYLQKMFDYGPYSAEDEVVPTSLSTNPEYTQVSYDDGTMSLKDVHGMLTRKALMHDDTVKRIELYISKVNDNKSQLSDSTAWQSLVLSDENAFSAYVSAEIDAIFNTHMKNYHLDGNLSRDEVEQVLLRSDLSNFNIDDVQRKIEIKSHDQLLNSDGFDYVVDYKRTPTSIKVHDGKNSTLYQWYRLWNSGLLEHGGIVECMPIDSSAQVSQDAYIKVDLRGPAGDYPVYNYDVLSADDFGSQYEQLFYGRKADSTTEWKEMILPNEGGLGKVRYTISLTPTVFAAEDIREKDFKYNDIQQLSTHSYPESATANKNTTYLVTEVHHVKNDSFCFTRSDTSTLDGSVVQYYQYYTVGYKADWKRYDYDLANVTVQNLQDSYAWTGSPITPSLTLTNAYGKLLTQDVDYAIEYYDNVNPGVGTVVVRGKGKYFNERIFKFKIKK